MFRPRIPSEITIHQHLYTKLEEIPDDLFNKIRAGFESQKTASPLVSVNIIAWNEEENILRNLSSLSAVKSSVAVEYIFVDNNSKDNTSEIIRRCGITPVPETKQGYGFARQSAMENSHGKYILTGDADTIYPTTWIDTMLKPVLSGKYIASSGTYSFIPGKGETRFRYLIYEFFRDIIHYLRSINRPYLVVGGVNFLFPRDVALRTGFIKSDSRSEDGSMALALMKTGKIKRVTSLKAAAWTVTRSIERTGTFTEAISKRITKEIKRIKIYFSKHD